MPGFIVTHIVRCPLMSLFEEPPEPDLGNFRMTLSMSCVNVCRQTSNIMHHEYTKEVIVEALISKECFQTV